MIVFVSSCTSNTIYKAPEDLIPEEKMIELLTDLYIASAASTIPNHTQTKQMAYFQLVYQKHNIDSTRFKVSNAYYTTKIDLYEKILLKVEEKLKKIKDSIVQIENDSIKPNHSLAR